MDLYPYQQCMSFDQLKQRQGLTGDEELTSDEIDTILSFEEENSRRGNF